MTKRVGFKIKRGEKMIQNENNGSKKIKENKYKILRMSLLLGTDTDKEETINNFCDASREIDSMNNETYLAELEDKFYETSTLEEESKRLTDLVDYIAGRISQRESLISDFINVTGRTLTGLGEIKYENKLMEYQDRLTYINEYLSNSKKIEEETAELERLTTRLKEEEYQKEENETKNSELENLLRKKFTTIASSKIDIDSLTEDNIDEKLRELRAKTEESKKSLDIFTKSFETLKNAGISYEEENEYKSYVAGARDVYYEYKEEEYLLSIYKLLLTNETEYTKIYFKRETLNSLLDERTELRNILEIKEDDSLTSIYNILAHQTQIVEGQKENIDNISNITSKIKYIEERIEELKEENEKVEILAILKEYNIIDTYEDETKEIEISTEENEMDLEIPDFEFPELSIDNVGEETSHEKEEIVETEIEDETTESENEEEIELPINKPYKNNFVMGSHEPLSLNVDECVEKAKSVMKRVGKMLNIELPEEKNEIAEEEIEQPEENNIELPTVSPFLESTPMPTPVTTTPEIETQKEEPEVTIPMFTPEIEDKQEVPAVSPFLETETSEVKSPFISEPEAPTDTEESNVKNVLPSADSFWGNQAPSANDLEDNNSFPDLTVSNDDFFANNMDNFEFPNLDEFK